MGVNDEDNEIVVEVIRNPDNSVVEINGTSSLVEIISEEIDYSETQTTSHIIEVVRRYIDPIETEGDGISVEIVKEGRASAGTVDNEAIAAIVRLVYVANETPSGLKDGQNTIFQTASEYKPLSTRLFVNGLRQSTPDCYEESGGRTITLNFTPALDDVLLIDYIKL